LILGADKWGQDVLLKTIKGAETSIIVGLSALLAVLLALFRCNFGLLWWLGR
jgi:peptide/nickel transport system permease protein